MANELDVDENPPGSGESTLSRSYVMRLENPKPDRLVASISFSALPSAIPGLIFLAAAIEPGDAIC